MTNRPLRFVLPLVIAAIGTPALAADPVGEVRVYAFDRHPKGTLLWDTGLGNKIADGPTGPTLVGIQGWVDHKLADQLKTSGLMPAHITLVTFS